MFFSAALLVFALTALAQHAAAHPPHLVTHVDGGHNIVAKLPCVGCPLLVRGDDGEWAETRGESALVWRNGRPRDFALTLSLTTPHQLLHISLPYASTALTINTSPLLTPTAHLPRIRAAQIPLDSQVPPATSPLSLTDPSVPIFGLSYSYSLHRVSDSPALVIRFNVIEASTAATPRPLTFKLDRASQPALQLVLLRRPVVGAADPGPLYEIVRADVVPRDGSARSPRTMLWHEWDERGRKGTPGYVVSAVVDGVDEWVRSSVLGLFVFVGAVVGLFIVVCLFCIFGWGFWRDEYQQAQVGKGRTPRTAARWVGNDVERARGRFLSPHELGMRTRGAVVGLGKSD
jgi:hypothetical protein